MGKPALSDIKNNKVTHVSLHGREQACRDCTDLTDKAKTLIQELQLKNNDLLSLAEKFCI
jgi:geranylgeranyl pyrophosphate synthase